MSADVSSFTRDWAERMTMVFHEGPETPDGNLRFQSLERKDRCDSDVATLETAPRN